MTESSEWSDMKRQLGQVSALLLVSWVDGMLRTWSFDRVVLYNG